jgi:hypothetical protein
MTKEKHIHKLRRYKFKSGNVIYHCTLPDCSYKSAPALAIGKRSICNRCGEQFILTDYSVRLAKPHCENCHKSKNNNSHSGTEYKEMTAKQAIEIVEEEEMIESSLAERLAAIVGKPVEEEEL